MNAISNGIMTMLQVLHFYGRSTVIPGIVNFLQVYTDKTQKHTCFTFDSIYAINGRYVQYSV